MRLLCLVSLASLLAACGTTPPAPTPTAEVWIGVGQSASNPAYNVRVEAQRGGARLLGTYTLSGSTTGRGTIDGTVSGSRFAGTLAPSSSCTYDATGTLDGTAFDVTFTVRSCLGGANGTWRLLKQ